MPTLHFSRKGAKAQREEVMIKEIEIENFRCFEHTKISGFERVNLIGGKNNSGKTALLEALLIYACPTARSILEIEQIIRTKSLDFVKSLPDRAWDNFFFNQNKASAITIVGKIEEKDSKIIKILTGDLKDLDEEKDIKTLTKVYSESDSISVLNIKIEENRKEKIQYHLIATSDGILGSKSTDTANISPIIPASFRISSKKLIEEYDKARLDHKDSEVLKGFKILDDSIEAVESFSIGEPSLYLTRKNQGRLPLSLFGDAINKMAVIILNLINNNDKILLIDEVENGIHYTNQREFWNNLFRLSIEYDVQIFATTHSLEMIQAFVEAGLNYKKTGVYFELARSPRTNQIIGIKRELETLEYALKHGKGVRGE
jgi:AAA15 family ATPase/GTPase